MGPLRLSIEDGRFCDQYGRQVILRGINVAGDAKNPSSPEQPSHVDTDFFDGDSVNFRKRPFTRDEAHTHFSRLKRCGYNTIRYVFTWEAIEAAGPGIYDEEWIQHTVEILRIAKDYGFYVFMDPHQDVWSRFCGGSGAPMWTLFACGLNPQSFAATEAAIVHNVYPDPLTFPKMIWSTNYYRLAAATMFTLFFAGRDFAPKCIIDGVNIQDYLQGHFTRAMGHLARRIHEAGDLENDVVFGWESMNEPNRGMIGHQDVSVIPREQALKKGTTPTAWQTMLTGSGRACEVDTWDMGGMGPYKSGRTLVDPHGEVAWLPAGYDESRYGYKRDPGWKSGECIWAQHGLWNPATDTLLRKDYFGRNPRTGETIDYHTFTNTYFMDFFRTFRDTIRSHHRDAIILLQAPVMELPPRIKGTPDDEPNLVYAPHFYDGITLMTKKWNKHWNIDVLGYLRGRYLHPAFAIKIGETAIRNCFRDQLAAIKAEGIENMGKHPCILTEFGIPYDMDDKHAYETGDYSSQSAAMDANHYGVEGALLDGYALWLYMATNDHERGDQWNGEDLSIYSVDDMPLPVSAVPTRLAYESRSSVASSPQKPGTPPPSAAAVMVAALRDTGGDDSKVTPANLKRTLTTPSISSSGQTRSGPDVTVAPGYRAAEAYVRPFPAASQGRIDSYAFDLKRCEFTLHLQAAPAPPERPTVVLLPEYHFPKDSCVVEVSSGKWELSTDDGGEGGVCLERLQWWHADGKQSLRVTGLARRHNYVEGVSDEVGYYEQLNQWANNCALM